MISIIHCKTYKLSLSLILASDDCSLRLLLTHWTHAIILEVLACEAGQTENRNLTKYQVIYIINIPIGSMYRLWCIYLHLVESCGLSMQVSIPYMDPTGTVEGYSSPFHCASSWLSMFNVLLQSCPPRNTRRDHAMTFTLLGFHWSCAGYQRLFMDCEALIFTHPKNNKEISLAKWWWKDP